MEHSTESKLKSYIYYGIMFLIVAVCIELLSQITFFIIFGKRYSPENFRRFVAHSYDATDQRANFINTEIIHPYIGYVIDMGDEKRNFTGRGFFNPISPVVKREAGKVNIVVLGGSVANGLPKYIEHAWEKTFKATPRVINLALPGFKEPQQLMALTYFLALGAQYDLVINVDGFNDIVLPYVENYETGVNPFFPRSWELRIKENPTPRVLAAMGKMKYFQGIKRTRLSELSSSIFKASATYGLFKLVQLMKNNRDIYQSTTALLNLQKYSKKSFAASGPVKKYANDLKMFEAAADFWARCSLLINGLAKQNGFAYYQFLQPDQYVKGSKRLTWEEKRIAYSERHIYRQPVVIGYPLLRDRGKMLVQHHVNFFDATMVFANIKETIYNDDCCHFNRKGKQILADFIIQGISRHGKFAKLKPATKLPKLVSY